MADEADSKSVVGNHVWVIKSLDFTGFARLSFQKVIKKVIKYLSEGILIEKLNKIKGGNLVYMMLKRNSIRFEFNWHDDIKR